MVIRDRDNQAVRAAAAAVLAVVDGAVASLVEGYTEVRRQMARWEETLLATLDTYFAAGSVTAETARRLHLSVRAVTYRLDRITTLTGHDPTDPAQRFTINAAVLGAKLLGWPENDLG
jgi:DNA-binding PucR family transcriptional regulator